MSEPTKAQIEAAQRCLDEYSFYGDPISHPMKSIIARALAAAHQAGREEMRQACIKLASLVEWKNSPSIFRSDLVAAIASLDPKPEQQNGQS